MAFYKITEEELNSRGVTTLPTEPLPPTDAIKQEFDAAAKEIIAPAFNELIDLLEDSGAAAGIGAVAPEGQTGDNAQSLLYSLCDYVTDNDIKAMFPNLVPFGTGTDEEISDMIEGYYSGLYSIDDIKSVWNIGDTRDINIEAIAASATGDYPWSVGESHRAQTVTIQILDFEHDTLSTSINGKTKALITVDLKNCLRDAVVTDTDGQYNTEMGYMHHSNSNLGGWSECDRRNWCNNGFYNALPGYIKTQVKTVSKASSIGNRSSTINYTTDKVFLLAEIEAFREVHYSFSGEGYGYPWYTTLNLTPNGLPYPDTYSLSPDLERYNHRNKKPGYTSSYFSNGWYLRSPQKNDNGSYATSGYGNNTAGRYASVKFGIAPAFCM